MTLPEDDPPTTRPSGRTTSWSGTRRGFPPKTARRIIRRDQTCQLEFPGCTTKATEADHIVGWADALAAGWEPEDIDDETNGQGACSSCHRIKTQQEIARGKQRAAARKPRQRPRPKHPGLR